MTNDLPDQQAHTQLGDTLEVVLATIPQRSDNTMLELVMLPGADGSTNIELRSLAWGSGLGWYRQHTLQLDGAAAHHLIQALGVVERRVERQDRDLLGRKVLPFPLPPQRRGARA
jgi:hypothetical protein